jgi:DNA polymerase (family 10)
MDNLELARIFSRIADILEIKNENLFKIRAYRRITQVLESLPSDINQLYKEDKIEDIPGVGEGIAEKIKELIETGKLKYYEELKKKVPEGLLEMMNIPEVGPKTVSLLYKKLGVDSMEKLKKVASEGKIRDLPGMGEKTEENILKGIELVRKREERIPLQEALFLAEKITKPLEKLKEVKRISLAGSLRRMRETIGDIDILLVSNNPKKVMEKFTSLKIVKEVLSKGDTKSSILMHGGRQVDLRVVPKESFGSALHYFTGSKSHNIKIRELGIKKGLKINEYGVFTRTKRKEEMIAGKEEKDVFKSVGLPFIPVELREDRGEIEAGLNNKLPELITVKDIKGDLHVHSKWSDGNNTIEEMAKAAKSRGYEYIGISDHSQSLRVAGGVQEKDFLKRIEEIKEADKKISGIKILAGSEVDIDSEGNLDYPNKLLKELDFVIAAIHTGFKQTKEKLTKRIIRAMESRYADIIAHPTGRLLGEREAYELDFEEIFKIAKTTGAILEINAFPNRMDLNDINARTAKEEGIKLIINTDSHHTMQLDWIKFGIAVARRAWLEKKDIVNTYPLEKLLKSLKKRK